MHPDALQNVKVKGIFVESKMYVAPLWSAERKKEHGVNLFILWVYKSLCMLYKLCSRIQIHAHGLDWETPWRRIAKPWAMSTDLHMALYFPQLTLGELCKDDFIPL